MIQILSADQIWPLRAKILRPGMPVEKSKYTTDLDQAVFHLGYLEEKAIIGVCTFIPERHPWLMATRPFRLRGMATDTEKQNAGVGRQMLLRSFEELQTRGCDLLWCNARENAFGFYLKLGFHFLGPMFELDGIGPHKVMYKILASR